MPISLAPGAEFCSALGRARAASVTPSMDVDGTLETPVSRVPEEPEDSNRETRASDKIGFGEKMALGSGYLAIFYGNSGVKSLAIPVYQIVLEVNPAVLGLARRGVILS
jgi:hypothetical protein